MNFQRPRLALGESDFPGHYPALQFLRPQSDLQRLIY